MDRKIYSNKIVAQTKHHIPTQRQDLTNTAAQLNCHVERSWCAEELCSSVMDDFSEEIKDTGVIRHTSMSDVIDDL